MEAVLWIARTGSPWRDLPERFGNWSTAFRRFRDWREADVSKRIFDALSDESDLEYAMVDATIVKVHRRGQGAKRGTWSQAIGRSKGGMTTKIPALTDALGNLVRFRLMPGQRYDSVEVLPLIDGITFDGLIADKAFESNVSSTGVVPASLSPSTPVDRKSSRSTQPSTLGATSSRTSSASSRSSSASPCAPAKPTGASKNDLPRRRRHQLTANPHRP